MATIPRAPRYCDHGSKVAHAVLLVVAAACGHTEQAAHGEATVLGPPATRAASADLPDAAETGDRARPEISIMDAGPEAEAIAVREDSGDGDAPTARPISRCLEDAGAPKRTLIRFVNRATPSQERYCPGEKQLALEIPSLGIVRPLCNSGCGPYDFDSQQKGPDVATFVCENDSVQNTGTASVVDDVLYVRYFEKPRPATPFDESPSSGSSSPVLSPLPPIALPCGTRPQFQTAGRSQWFGDVPGRGSSR
jgi:hypothetical protein